MSHTKPQTYKDKLKEYFIPSEGQKIVVTYAGDTFEPAYRDGNLDKSDNFTKVRAVNVNRPIANLPACVTDIKTIMTGLSRYGVVDRGENNIYVLDSTST